MSREIPLKPNMLKYYRELCGLRQKHISKKLKHKSSSQLCKWEKGLVAPDLINLLKLSRMYSVPVNSLYQHQCEKISEAETKREEKKNSARD